MENRISRLSENLNKGEAVIITDDTTRRYLCGFKSSAGVIVITKDTSVLFIDSRYFEKASETVTDCKVVLFKDKYAQLKEFLLSLDITCLYCETCRISVAEFAELKEKLDFLDISSDGKIDKLLLKEREIKSDEEIGFIRYAQSLTDKTFLHILEFIREGKTERETALEMEFFMRRLGSDGIAFDFIAVSGKNSSLPHGVPTDKPFMNGDFITLDFGARYNGYCSDMTRTVAVGSVSDKQKEVYDTVLSAQTAALAVIKSGALCSEVDKTARDIIESAGYGDYFGHAFGHSLGLDIHESPACSPKSKSILKSGMFMTAEPGIYIPGEFGVRIEDMVLVTDGGCENLTESPKNLIILSK